MSSDQSREKKDNNTVAGLAAKMQAGWTLLASCCPQCNTPLVREKGAKRMFCVGCEMWVMREEDMAELQQQGSRASAAGAGAVEEKKQAPGAAGEKPLSSLESGLASLSQHGLFGRLTRELREVNEGKSVAEAEEASARAGNADTARPPRSLRRRRDAQDDDEEEEDEEEEEDDEEAHIASYASRPNKTAETAARRLEELSASRSERQARLLAEEREREAAQARVDPLALSAAARRTDSLSARLGAKMLAGWTLLGDHCPNERCQCPLMRARGDHDSQKLACVNCGATVKKSGDELTIVANGNSVPVGSNSTATSTKQEAAPAEKSVSSAVSSARKAASAGRRRGGADSEDEEGADADDSAPEDEDEHALLARLEREDALRAAAAERSGVPINSFASYFAAPVSSSAASTSTAAPSSAPSASQTPSSLSVPPRSRAPSAAGPFSPALRLKPHVAFEEDPYSLADLPEDLSDAAVAAGGLQKPQGSNTNSKPAASSASSATTNPSSDVVSARLGEKMLQGWALLGSCCPRDNCVGCPLVRRRDGPLLCVACGSTVIDKAEYDEAQHGPKGNEPGEDGKIAVNPAQAKQNAAAAAATASKSAAAAAISARQSPPATSATVEFQDDELTRHTDKKQRSSGGGSHSTSSSGLPSPNAPSRYPSQSQQQGHDAFDLSHVDSRLKSSLLGGSRGRLGSGAAPTRPHSRAPSFAVPSGGSAGFGSASHHFPGSLGPHTSSAALNAAAQVAFGRFGGRFGAGSPSPMAGAGSAEHHHHLSTGTGRSGQSSLEQSPRHAPSSTRSAPHGTPPATPIPVSAFSTSTTGGNRGSLNQQQMQQRFSYESLPAPAVSGQPRGGVTGNNQLPSFALSPSEGGGFLPQAQAQQQGSAAGQSMSGVFASASSALLARLEDCARMLQATEDLEQWRNISNTMRSLADTARALQQHNTQQ